MLQIWGKLLNAHRIVESYTAEREGEAFADDFPKLFGDCLDEIIRALDLPKPIMLPQNERELVAFHKTEFRQEHFIEAFPYKAFEVEIIITEEE